MGSRYYESNLKEDEIKPGKISDELKAALNLADNDLPIWIYRMRALGYPPGWLNKAIVDTSDIFDGDEGDGEEGSKKRKNPSEEVQYDHSKLIEYPGFNAPLPPNVTDYHYYYNMPPMLAHQQLDYAKQHMSAFEPAPVPKRIRTSTTTAEQPSTSKKKKRNSKNQDDSVQEKKNQSLNDNNGEGEDPASPDDEAQEGEDDDTSGDGDEDNGDGNDDKDESSEEEQSADTPAKVKSNLSSSLSEEIKLVSKGSPMPQMVRRLPLERFSEGVVGELLYFENTPTSSGKFETIRGLLDTIRRQD